MSSGKSAVKAAISVNGAIATIKLIGGIMSGSAAMLAEFGHSMVDTGNSLFLLKSLSEQDKKADERFHFGHGKKAFFWTFIASLGMIFIGGAFSIYHGIETIMHPGHLEHFVLSMIIYALSICFEGFSVFKAVQAIFSAAGEKLTIKSMHHSVKHLSEVEPSTKFIFFEDCAALVGLFIAVGFEITAHITDNPIYVGIASVIIGAILFVLGFISAKENMEGFIGEAAEPELTLEVGRYIRRLAGVKDIREIKSMTVGPDKYFYGVVIEIDGSIKTSESDDIMARIQKSVKDFFDEIDYVFVSAIEYDKINHWAIEEKELLEEIFEIN
jgi:cation diffusion facilitator family transporter